MNAPLAARLPLEVLDDVGDVDARSVDARVGERAIEEFAGRSDERMTCEIFVVAGLLADEHQLSPRPAFTENGLRPALPEIACVTLARGLANARQRRPIRNQRRRVGFRIAVGDDLLLVALGHRRAPLRFAEPS